MDFEEVEFLSKLKSKGFLVFTLTMFLFMVIFLFTIDLIFDLIVNEKSFDFKTFLFWDLPINILISIIFAIFSWKFENKKLKLKSDMVEIKLNENNGKKEK